LLENNENQIERKELIQNLITTKLYAQVYGTKFLSIFHCFGLVEIQSEFVKTFPIRSHLIQYFFRIICKQIYFLNTKN